MSGVTSGATMRSGEKILDSQFHYIRIISQGFQTNDYDGMDIPE